MQFLEDNILSLTAIFISLAVGAWNILINRGRLQIMQQQLDDAKTRQQYYQTITWMEGSLPAVDRVMTLEGKEVWDEDDEKAARTLCYRFHMLGIMIHKRMMDEEDICNTWYYSIQKCYLILLPYIQKKRCERHPLYYTGMDYLAEKTAMRAKRFNGFQSPDFEEELVVAQIRLNLAAKKASTSNAANKFKLR